MGRWVIYRERGEKRDYRWRYRADNGKVIADSAEGYANRSDCENGIRIMKTKAPDDEVIDMSTIRRTASLKRPRVRARAEM